MSDLTRKLVPQKFHPTLRRAWDRLNHRYQTKKLFGRDAEFIPPVRLMHDGPRTYLDFKENGDKFFRHYVELCGLKPDDEMLDLGCGIGRKTLPLTRYLSERGSYVGMDIVKSGVDWCTEKYTSKWPNFKFQLIDVYNDLYNPEGKYQAAEYRWGMIADMVRRVSRHLPKVWSKAFAVFCILPCMLFKYHHLLWRHPTPRQKQRRTINSRSAAQP